MGEHKFKKKRQTGYKARRSRSFATTVIVLVAIAVMIGIDVLQRNQSSPLDYFVPERTKGSEDAPLKIVEFLDFQCPHCAQGAAKLKEYMEEYPGAIQLTLKYYPLDQLNSYMSAYYAECAARQGKFWEMHDALMNNQDSWRTLLKVKPYLNGLAQEAGLNLERLNECTESKDVKTVVNREKAIGGSNFVKSTPTYFVNGQMAVGIHALEGMLKEFFEKQTSEPM